MKHRDLYVCPNTTATNPHPTKRIFSGAILKPHRNAMSTYLWKCCKCGARLELQLEEPKTKTKTKANTVSSMSELSELLSQI